MGIRSMKCPLDLWIYQEILIKTKPDIIIETGTNEGGTTLFLANICDIMDNGEIITIDISSPNEKPKHKRIHYIQGDATSKKTITKITTYVRPKLIQTPISITNREKQKSCKGRSVARCPELCTIICE